MVEMKSEKNFHRSNEESYQRIILKKKKKKPGPDGFSWKPNFLEAR